MAAVVEITGDDELWAACMRQNHADWGGALTPEQHLRRARQTQDVLVHAGMTLRQFAVVVGPSAAKRDAAVPAVDARDIAGSCLVLSRPLYCGARRMAQDHCVACVYVAREHRRRGLAKQLMDHVVEEYMANDDDQISLWSDVGAYYERSGFEFAPALDASPPHATIVCRAAPPPPRRPPPPPRQGAGQGAVQCEWLSQADMSAIAVEHARQLTRAVDVLRLDARGAAQFCAVLPSEALYKQLQLQPVLEQQMLGRTVPTKFGARTPNGHGWAAWTYQFQFGALLVLGISGSADEVAALVAAAAEAAAEFDGLDVRLFESQLADKELDVSEVLAALETRGLDFKYGPRQRMLPMSIGDAVYAFPGGYAFF